MITKHKSRFNRIRCHRYKFDPLAKAFAIYIRDGKKVGSRLIFEEDGDDEVKLFLVLEVFVFQSARNKGLGTKLLRILFKHAKKENAIIVPGHFEPDGEKYLKHVIRRFAKEYDVKVNWN